MKKLAAGIIFILGCSIFAQMSMPAHKDEAGGSDSLKVLAPEEHHKKEDLLIMTLLQRYHYKKSNINDSLSSVVLDRYIKALDYNKSYFLASDIKNFEKYRTELDDDVKIGKLNPAYDIYNVFMQRFRQRDEHLKKLLEKEFDFNVDEEYRYDRKDVPWPQSQSELDEIWRKRIKNEALSIKLTGKDWKAISETLQKRYANYTKRMTQFNSEDVFQLFMNQFSESIDPHTNYLSPISADNFNMNMSNALEGIGAVLKQEDDYTAIEEIVVGGPAYKSKQLKRNDKIIAVAQGDDGEFIDVIGWRLDEVVQKIRGPKGTTVRLQVLPGDAGLNASPKEVKIVRDKVKLEEQAAKKEVIDIKQNGTPFKMGIITIPGFYFDYKAQQRGEKDFASTTRDVRRLIKELQNEKVDGIIVDLRNNGGGSLQEAIELTGLFIKNGPVVQVRSSDGSVEVGEDPDPDLVYSGPLAVMVNRFSASASEIFAGAIQDYQRGLVIGEQTYGKGTVQNLIDLNRFGRGESEKLGQLKLTIAKFYRINGGSTQHKGVIPDVTFPSAYDSTEFRESSEPSALPWDQIAPTNFSSYENLKKVIPQLVAKHNQRANSDKDLKKYIQEIEEFRKDHNKKTVSLLESKRKAEKEEAEKKKKSLENIADDEGIEMIDNPEVTPKEQKAKDPLIKETANILGDMILLTAK